jgi:XRE family transcriptional regulator, regulator of sulfur utilization
LGQRVRALRKQRGLSQERLGDRSSLSGKFIGEVERGEKSISIDSLYRVSVALEIPLRELTAVRADKPSAVPSEEAEKIFALVSGRRRRGARHPNDQEPIGRSNHRGACDVDIRRTDPRLHR